MHFGRDATEEELLNVRRHVSGQKFTKSGSIKKSGTIVKMPSRVRTSMMTASTGSRAYAETAKKYCDQTEVVTAPCLLRTEQFSNLSSDHSELIERQTNHQKSIRSSHLILSTAVTISNCSSYDVACDDVVSFGEGYGAEYRDNMETLDIMLLPMIETPPKQEYYYSSQSPEECLTDEPAALTFVSTDTPEIKSPDTYSGQAGVGANGSLSTFMARQHAGAVDHTWDLVAPPAEDPMRADTVVTTKPWLPSTQSLRCGFGDPRRQAVVSRATSDARIALLAAVPSAIPSVFEDSRNVSIAETSPIVPITANRCFPCTPAEFPRLVKVDDLRITGENSESTI
jgi:hypothetical protein